MLWILLFLLFLIYYVLYLLSKHKKLGRPLDEIAIAYGGHLVPSQLLKLAS